MLSSQILRPFYVFLVVAANATAVNPNGIKTLLAHKKSYFIKGKQAFSNGPESLPRNPPDCTISDS